MSDKDKYYIDGYGTKRPKDVPFWDSAKGQLVKKAGNDLLTTGSFALGLLLPFGKLKILKTLSRVLNGAAIADFVTSDRVTTVDDDIKNGEYGKAAVTGLEALLTAGAIGSGFSKLPGVQKRAAMFARDGLVKDKMVVHRAHPYKLSEDVLKNIPMYNWESVANRIRNSFGISGGLGATGTYIYLRNEKGSR